MPRTSCIMSIIRCVASALVLPPSVTWFHNAHAATSTASSMFGVLAFSNMRQDARRGFGTTRPLHRRHFVTGTQAKWMLHSESSDNDSGISQTQPPEPLANLYFEWSLQDDKFLWGHRDESLAFLAERLGRGLRGVHARLRKLKDVDTSAYERLFAAKKKGGDILEESTKKEKLVPVSELLRRVQWDYLLSPSDFSILHYDRVDDTVVESPMDAPNTSVKGGDKLLMDALPEHRIVAVKYKERVVWDRERRLDIFFAGDGIEQVMETYDEWKRNKDASESGLRERQTEIAARFRRILGLERYSIFKIMSNDLRVMLDDPFVSAKVEAEKYVQSALQLFNQVQEDPTNSLQPALIPRTDLEALECLSELVALSPSGRLRPVVLDEISIVIQHLERSQEVADMAAAMGNHSLPELNEDDLTETFVRGSGPGGQKINKTNSKVLLVHNPTNLRVECQDTRSLQQNRKIARKRLQLKLDEFLNGSQSRASIKAQKAATKKAKAKAKARARHQKKAKAKKGGSDSDGD